MSDRNTNVTETSAAGLPSATPVSTVDEYGRVRIPFGLPENRPGYIEVDGDLYAEGPVAILHFEAGSEPPNEVVAYPEGEIDFGTFRLAFDGTARFVTGVTLNREQALALAAALVEKVKAEDG